MKKILMKIIKEKKEKDITANNNLDFHLEGFKPDKKNQNKISLVDESKFNRLKINIIKNSDTSIIFYLKLFSIFFIIFSIALIIYDSIVNKNNLNDMDEFLTRNLIFNHTKISSGKIFLEAEFFKFMIENYINNDDCFTSTCRLVVVEGFQNSLNDLQKQKSIFTKLGTKEDKNSEIIKSLSDVTIYNVDRIDVVKANMEIIINLLINYCLRIIEINNEYLPKNWDGAIEYIQNSKSFDHNQYEISQQLNISLTNLIEQSLHFADFDRKGYNEKEKEERINTSFNQFPISLVIMLILSILLIGIFFYFIYYLYTYEAYFIERLIDFNNQKFEAYVKQLEELKKKLRNENEDTKKEKEEQKKSKRMKGKEKSKLLHQQKKKKLMMRKFFLKMDIFQCIKILIIVIIGLSYYIFSSVIESSVKNDYLEKDYISDRTEGIFKYSLDIHISLLENLRYLIEFVDSENILNNNGIIEVNNKTYTKSDINSFIDENFPNITLQNINEIEYPHLGDLLMPIISKALGDDDESTESQLNQLYNGDACEYLFKNNIKAIENCKSFWNGIMSKGMEQALTQMSVSISSVLDELKDVNKKSVTKEEILKLFKPDSNFFQFHFFMEYYFYEAYLRTSELFSVLRKDIVSTIEIKFNSLLIVFLIINIVLFFFIILYIYSIRNYFNSFLYFIAIFPLKFLAEEENLFRQILKLNDNMFR